MRGDCTVLGTVRALGLHSSVQRSGVKVFNVYQPGLPYSDTDLEVRTREREEREEREDHHHHSPSYIRDYTGYMALRLADTAGPGTAWNFSPEMRLEEVGPADINTSCGLTNKMCYWLGKFHTVTTPPCLCLCKPKNGQMEFIGWGGGTSFYTITLHLNINEQKTKILCTSLYIYI